MKFLRAEIYGFGKWVDKTFDFSHGLLTCFYGENEAGKSTLQNFLLFMLFGLPPRKRNTYQPKNSNRIGGTLTIEDGEIGTYTIERISNQVKCLLPHGEEQDEAWLKQRLKGATKEIYTSIYAFSANDLVEIRRMKQEQLSDVLFSVGLTGATAIYEVERKLDNKLGALFKKAGRIPKINKQIKIVEESHEKLLTFQKSAKTYRAKIELKEKLHKNIGELKTSVQSAQTMLYEKEKQNFMLPYLKEYKETLKGLEAYKEEITFPEDGINRYQLIKNNILPLQSERIVLENSSNEYQDKKDQLKNELYPVSVYEAAQSIIDEKHADENWKRQIAEKGKESARLDSLVKEKLRPLDIKEKDLEETVLPFHIESTWQEIKDTNEELQREGEQLAEDHALITEEMTRLQKEEKEIEKEMLPEEQVTEMQMKVNEYDLMQTVNRQETEQKKMMSTWKQKQDRLAMGTLIGTIILTIASVFLALKAENFSLFAITALIVSVGVAQSAILKESTKESNGNSTKNLFTSKISKQERLEFEQVIKRNQELQAILRTIKNEEKQLELQKLKWEERKRIYDQKESQWLDRLKTEQYQYPFLNDIEPNYWIELLHRIQKTKQLLFEKNEVKEELAVLYSKREKFERKIDLFAEDIGWDKGEITVTDIEQILEKYHRNLQSIEEYNLLLAQNEKKQKELKVKIASYQKELNTLLEIADAPDEETYFKTARELEDKNKLTDRMRELKQMIEERITEEKLEDFININIGHHQLERDVQHIKEELDDAQIEISDLTKQLAEVNYSIGQMESSDSNSEAAFLYELEKEKLNSLAKEWAVAQIAQTALFQAKESYQEKYLTEVIQLTSKYFRTLTDGKYEKVYAPTARTLFQVEASNFMRYTVEELSQGTIDQLYVSLRLAISKVMSNKYVLPLIIDDAFVHFDEKRTDRMITILKQFAEKQQVIFFTCKQELANKLEMEDIAKNTVV